MMKVRCMKWRSARGFWLGKYEVTQEQWEAVMETTPWVLVGWG